jgi:hypothetical protein
MLKKDNQDIIDSTKSRVLYLYQEMKKLNQIYVDCSTSKQSISDLCITITVKDIKKRYEENIALFENTQKNTRNLFISVVEDLTQLISIFVNLLISNDYSISLKNLLADDGNEGDDKKENVKEKKSKDPSKDRFFKELENVYLENLDEELLKEIYTIQNSTKIVSYQSQLEVLIIMIKPKGSIAADKSITLLM